MPTLPPLPPVKAQFFDNLGDPLAGGKVYFYEPDGMYLTPKPTYSDAAGLVPNADPVVLDAAGRAAIYINGLYDVLVKDKDDVGVYGGADISSASSDVAAFTQWEAVGLTPLYVAASQFSVQTDATGTFEVGLRVKLTDTGVDYFGTVLAATYSLGTTTVTVALDSGVLTAGLSSVEISRLTVSDRSLPVVPSATKTDTYVLAATDHGRTVIADKATAITFTLPAAGAVANGWRVLVKNIGAGLLTLSGTVDGVVDPTLSQYGSMEIVCDGTSFRRVANEVLAAEGALKKVSTTPIAQGIPASGVLAELDRDWFPHMTPYWIQAALVGSGFAIATVGWPALAALNGTDVAFIDSSNDSLRTYRFNGSTWSLVGSGLAIGTVGYSALAALNGTDVAFIDNTSMSLRTYRFDGANWAQVGSGVEIPGAIVPALAALNGTDVAFIDSSNDSLRTYRFNGSTWSLVGSGLAIGTVGWPALTALNGTDVAFIDFTNMSLRTYRFNGSTWSLVGSGLAIATVSVPALAALNGTDVAFIDNFNDSLRTYRFDGSTWSQVGSGLAIATAGAPALAALNGTDVAFIDDTNMSLRTYRFAFSRDVPRWY